MLQKVMHVLMTSAITLAVLLLISTIVNVASAAEEGELDAQTWPHHGILGTYDDEALRRGREIYSNFCSGCHGLSLVAFRNLTEIGYTEDEAKEIASFSFVPGEPDDFGDVSDRPAILTDQFPDPYTNEQMARSMNFGALPPDLSVIVKARAGGEDYIYSLLTGYGHEVPEDVTLMDGMSWNPVFPSGQIAMGQPIYEDMVYDAEGNAVSLEQAVHDVVSFLAWAAEPRLEDRKSIGVRVMIFLFILTVLFIFVSRRVWADVK